MALSNQQQAIVDSEAKRLMALAGAGAGKTFTVVSKIGNYIKNGLAPRNIAVITFTNDATDSLVTRLEKAGYEADGLTVKTLHSFAYMLIRYLYELSNRGKPPKILSDSNNFQGNFWKLISVYDKKDENVQWHTSKMPHKSWKIYHDVINSFQLAKLKPADMINETFGMTPKQFRQSFIDGKWKKSDREAWNLLWYLEYETWKEASKQIDYNDVLLVAIKELENASEKNLRFLRNKFKVLIIDESQDTNALVIDILRRLTVPETTVIMVGDIRQSIYSFINASPKSILAYAEAEGFERLTLNSNYRSAKEIVDNANYFIGHYPSFNIGGDMINVKGLAGHPVTSLMSTDELSEVHSVSELIYELKEQGYNYKDMCVLFRTNAQAMLMLNWCITSGVPFCIKSDTSSIFDRGEMKDILTYLKIFNDIRNTTREDFKRILNKPSRFISNVAFASVAQDMKDKEKGFGLKVLEGYVSHPAMKTFADDMNKHRRACRKLPLGGQIQYILLNMGYAQWWEKSDDKDKHLDLAIYASALTSLTHTHKEYDALIKHIEEIRVALKEKNTEDGITFTTIHSSKGLEWPVCIVLGVCSRLYPFHRALDENGIEGEEEEARLFYVASTRPEKQLFYSEIIGNYGRYRATRSPFINQTLTKPRNEIY